MRKYLILPLAFWAFAPEGRAQATSATAVDILADHHTSRWTSAGEPLLEISGACSVIVSPPSYRLDCSTASVLEPRGGRRHFFSIVLFRDLDGNVYMAACSASSAESRCGDLKAGQTFSAEVEGQIIRIVMGGGQLPLRILEFYPRPIAFDSLTRGTPSQLRPSVGAPSNAPYSEVAESRGSPSDVRPSEFSMAAGAPSAALPSDVSAALVSPNGARLYLYSSRGSAQVYVDGQLIGHPPIDVPLLPGRHTVLVREPGFRDWFSRIEIPAGTIAKITAELRR